MTLEQATMAAGLIPAQAGAPSARDQAISAAASVAGIAADKELAQAAKIQDPEARYIAEQKATDKYLRGLYALGGADLPQLSLADIAGGE